MGATFVEKIFSRGCGREVSPGEVVMAPVDAAMIHDITGPLAIQKFREMDGKRVNVVSHWMVVPEVQDQSDLANQLGTFSMKNQRK